MRTIFFPSHLDSGNRGCEAITKGSCEILGGEFGYEATTQNMELDSRMHYPESIKFTKLMDRSFAARAIKKLTRKFLPTTTADRIMFHLRYANTFSKYRKSDVILSTGGDMFCYGENLDTIRLIDFLYEKSMRTVLWGCSIGEENLTDRKIEVLNKFSAITVRESLSESVLKEKVGLKNVFRFPDPAFVLNPEKCELPEVMKKMVVGINLSNFVGANVGFDTIVGRNLVELFNTIIDQTNLNIVLFPHVFWQGQDDRIVCRAFYEKFKETGRVSILNTEELNYCQIRYAISQCRFFIGARTHAMISAYSTCVPAIALGYSIKARGIAKDLGLPQELVVDYRTLTETNGFSNSFLFATEHEDEIRKHMETVMPEYVENAYGMKKVVEEI